MATDIANRLEAAGVPYDRRWPDPKVTASRVVWSAAYRLAHEQADAAARKVTPGAPLPFDDLTPPTAVAARARAAVGKAPNLAAANTLERLATAVESAWRSASGAWGSPEQGQSVGTWLGTPEELAKYDHEVRRARVHGVLSADADLTAALGGGALAMVAQDARTESARILAAVTTRTGKSPDVVASPLTMISPPMLELEHALLELTAQAADFLAAVAA